MRFISLVFVLLFAVTVGAFALQNNEGISIHFFQWGISTSMALLIATVYLLGMVSGWAVVGLLRSSVARVTK